MRWGAVRQVLWELGKGVTASPELVLLVTPALPWHGRSCQLSLCPPAAGGMRLPAWTQGGMRWDVPGMQGRPRAIWSEATPRQGKQRPPLEGLGQSRIFIQKEARPGRPVSTCVHPCLSTSLRHAGQPPL